MNHFRLQNQVFDYFSSKCLRHIPKLKTLNFSKKGINLNKSIKLYLEYFNFILFIYCDDMFRPLFWATTVSQVRTEEFMQIKS